MSGQLSTTLHESLKNWASYYRKLYTNTFDRGVKVGNKPLGKHKLLLGERLKQLNAAISTPEVIHAINSLKDYSTSGKDMLLSWDFTILLHVEEGKKGADYPESLVIIDFLREVLAGFWSKEKVPNDAKETVYGHF